MNYQKTYMNHIHSSSLLCQLATMWKSQTLCDAIIRSGNNITRAHRVVLVAACPMLQSMENAASGSHLEVRVASDIKVESIHTFLQYLYEGFMTLTEENCRDVEKIARLLQVEGVVKCCADFHKCLNTSSAGQYKYSLLDQIEFRHVRTTELSKCQDRIQKRQSESGRISPVGKRQKVNRPSSPPSDHSMSQRMSDMHSMSESYMPDANDPWDRVPRLGASSGRSGGQPGVIDIVEDSLELIQTDPPGKHQGENNFDTRRVQQTVGISVASQHNKGADLQIVNVAEQAMSSAPRPQSDIIPSSPSSSSSSSFKDTANSSRPPDPRGAAGPPPPQLQRMDPGRQPQHGTINLVDIPHSPEPETSKQVSRQQGRSSDVFPPSSLPSAPQRGGDNFQSTTNPQRPPQPFPVSLTAVPRGGQSFQSKPYAAGSAVQAEALSPRGPRSQGRGDADRASPAERAKDSGSKSTPDIPDSAPDISIVKVEHSSSNLAGDTTGGLDMFVSDGGVSLTPVQGHGEDDEHSDFELEEPPGEMSKEGDMSNEGADQSANWYMGNMKVEATTSTFCTGYTVASEPGEISPSGDPVRVKVSPGAGHTVTPESLSEEMSLPSNTTRVKVSPGVGYTVTPESLSGEMSLSSNTTRVQRSPEYKLRTQTYLAYGTAEVKPQPQSLSVTPRGRGRPPREVYDVFSVPGSSLHIHRAVKIAMNGRQPCHYCKVAGVRRKKSRLIDTTHTCDKCRVPLCVGQRGCFQKFHNEVFHDNFTD